MKKILYTIFWTILLIVLYHVVQVVYYNITNEITYEKPKFRSVVFMDERTDCDKRYELKYIEKWEEFCGTDKCSLQNVERVKQSAMMVLQSCNDVHNSNISRS